MRGIKARNAPPRSARPPPGRALLQRHYPAQSLQYLAAIKRAPQRLQRPPAAGHRAACPATQMSASRPQPRLLPPPPRPQRMRHRVLGPPQVVAKDLPIRPVDIAIIAPPVM